MVQKTIAIIFAVLALAFACGSLAQEAKKEGKKETQAAAQTKQEAAKDAKKPTAPRTMKFVSCTKPDCGFWAKSHSAKELRGIMKRHAKKYHNVELTDKQLKEMVKKHEGK